MAQNCEMCQVGDDIKEKLKSFRFRQEKTVAAIILKIDINQKIVIVEEEYEDTSVEDLQSELPEHQPRYVVLSYVRNHDDGRTSYPLCFIYICPTGCNPELSMLYAGMRNPLQKQLGFTKDFELRSVEDFTEDWLKEKLAFFR